MERSERAVLSFVVIGIIAFGLGIILYVRRMMAEFGMGWDLQLAFLGLIIFLLGLMVSKILSKVST